MADDDWGESWQGLPAYPQLPKLLTSSKTAKKRKHKELVVTDELLDRPVQLPRQHAGAAAGAEEQPHGAAAADSKASKKHPKLEKQEQRGKHKQEGAETDAAAAAAAAAAAGAPPQQRQEGPTEKQKKKAVALAVAAQQQGGVAAAAPPAAEPPRKKSKNKFKQQQEQQQQDAAAAAAPPAAEPPRKKSKNKFKQQQEQQQQDAAAAAAPPAAEPPRKKSKNKFKQQQEQQQQDAAAAAVPHAEEPPRKQSKNKPEQEQLEKRLQQQQQPVQPQACQQQRKAAVSMQKVQHANGTASAPARVQPAAAAAKPAAAAAAAGSKLLQQFKERLQGSKFRQLNEALYTQPGDESFNLMQQQPELFTQYHQGFQQQVKSWPTQPLDAAIAWLSGQPQQLVVADFGCGDAQLAAGVKQRVHSLDLVAAAPGVIACNMADTPLESGSCDAAVFSLALMGTDYGSFLTEAARVLRKGGWLWIAEVRSRFTASGGKEDFGPFLRGLQQLGFQHSKTDASNQMFAVFVLRKARAVEPAAASRISWPHLKACVYKKR